MSSRPPLLELDAIDKSFAVDESLLRQLQRRLRREKAPRLLALDALSLSIGPGECLAVVGESGCGKSTLARIAAGLLRPDRGARRVGVPDLAIQMIFQHAAAALNPRLRVFDLLAEAPSMHGLLKGRDEQSLVAALLDSVGLDAALARHYPHQLSGGQQARVGIARALAVEPRLLICDEILASLDVLLQAQIIQLLQQLRQRMGLACLFISHDLGAVRRFSENMAVMYMGRIVEQGPTADIFAHPRHPYTQALLAAMPRMDGLPLAAIQGEQPSPLYPPPGCHFHTRCPEVMPVCKQETPPFCSFGPAHLASCHLYKRPTGGVLSPAD